MLNVLTTVDKGIKKLAYKRKCSNWLISWGEWAVPRCESPESFVFWSGLFTLSSALRRQVGITKDYLGNWDCYPHLYIILVGEAGKVRKTTAANYGIEMLEEIPFIVKGPQIATQAHYMQKLTESKDNSISIVSEEFSDLIMKSGEDMFQFLTSIFDGRKSIEAATIGRGVEFAAKPCINLLAATTPQWIAGNMPEAIIGGGFASRVIFIREDRVSKRRLFYNKIIDKNIIAGLRASLLSDLTHIAENVAGDFELTDEAQDKTEAWYQANADGNSTNPKLAGYYQRKPAYVLKIAQLLAISESDKLLLQWQHVKDALEIIEGIEEKLPSVFAGVGKNDQALTMEEIRSYIYREGPIMLSKVKFHFRSAAHPNKLHELIVNGLGAMGEISMEPKGTDMLLKGKHTVNFASISVFPQNGESK